MQSKGFFAESLPVRGCLYYFQQNWTFSSWAHIIVSGSLGLECSSPPPPLHVFYLRDSQEFLEFISKMILKGVLEKCRLLCLQRRRFSVEKRNLMERRVIPGLSLLNKFIWCSKFRITTIAHMRTLLPPGSFTCYIELSDAFWYVLVAQSL